MENIKELRTNLENYKKSRGTDVRTYTNILNDLNKVELEFESREKEIALYREKSDTYLKDSLLLKQEKEVLSAQVGRLAKEKSELETRLAVMQRERPALSSENLIGTFKTSLAEMNLGLKKAPERTKYHVISMNVKLRTNLAFEGTELKFQMPKADDIIPPGNLSEIEFTVQELPDKTAFSGYREVPDLAGLSLETAKNRLEEAGFSPGEVLEKESGAPQGTVLTQLPSAYALAEAKAPVDLVISRFSSVKVPNLLGLELESAEEVIDKSGLRTGPIRKQAADVKPGIVIAQSLRPGTDVEPGSGIGLVVSVEKTVSPVKEPVKETEKDSSSLREKTEKEMKRAGEDTQAPSPRPIRKVPVISRVETPAGPEQSVKKVPKLVGLPVKKALEVLEKEGIKVGKVSEINSRVAPETVMGQSPKAETIANPKIPVDLVVSKGSLRPGAPLPSLRPKVSSGSGHLS
ncbi:MAG: PASTA domain-containing protein [Methanosarcinaceae archaeon]|nr:PASTA domain-containing protein [Methanosarcinaceae archaeon]